MIRIYQDFIPKGCHNRPGYPIVPRYLTVHDTANASRGANAEAHARYLKSDAASESEVSWHFTVDDKMAVQHLPLREMGWHAGDSSKGPGNSTSIGVEVCENSDGDRYLAEQNAAQLVALLLRVLKLGVEEVVPHKRWIQKECPHILLPRWTWFLDLVRWDLKEDFTPIWGDSRVTVEAAKGWARSRGGTETFANLAEAYWDECAARGIRGDVAYAQSAKETAFGRFPGVVTPGHHNWCGLKTKAGGGNQDPNAHARFANDETGVLAHVQHLCRYAGIQLEEEIVDPRYELVVPGRAVTVEDLGGKWAPSQDYGASIVRDYLAGMLAFAASQRPEDGGSIELEAFRTRVVELEGKLAERRGELVVKTEIIERIKAAVKDV